MKIRKIKSKLKNKLLWFLGLFMNLLQFRGKLVRQEKRIKHISIRLIYMGLTVGYGLIVQEPIKIKKGKHTTTIEGDNNKKFITIYESNYFKAIELYKFISNAIVELNIKSFDEFLQKLENRRVCILDKVKFKHSLKKIKFDNI